MAQCRAVCEMTCEKWRGVIALDKCEENFTLIMWLLLLVPFSFQLISIPVCHQLVLQIWHIFILVWENISNGKKKKWILLEFFIFIFLSFSHPSSSVLSQITEFQPGCCKPLSVISVTCDIFEQLVKKKQKKNMWLLPWIMCKLCHSVALKGWRVKSG